MKRLLAACLALAVSLSATSCGDAASAAVTLRFSAIPDDNTTELKEKFERVAAYLSSELGVTVEYSPVSDYTASVEAFKTGDIQLAWFGGLTGVQARKAVPGARAIAQGKVDPQYKSYFIANASTGLELSDAFPTAIATHSFTFGDDASTSGRLMPEYFIRQNSGKSPEEFFGAPNAYSKSHDKTAKLVEAGTFDVGALSYKAYDGMVAEGKIDPEQCRIIWVTPNYADYNWTAHPDLDSEHGAGFIDRLQRALVEMQDPALLSAMRREEGLIEATNADFQSIHDLAADLGFLKK